MQDEWNTEGSLSCYLFVDIPKRERTNQLLPQKQTWKHTTTKSPLLKSPWEEEVTFQLTDWRIKCLVMNCEKKHHLLLLNSFLEVVQQEQGVDVLEVDYLDSASILPYIFNTKYHMPNFINSYTIYIN